MNPEVAALLKRVGNGYLLFVVSLFGWGPIIQFFDDLLFGMNPLVLLIGFSVCALVIDLADYENTPTLKGVFFGTLLAPFWLILRKHLIKL